LPQEIRALNRYKSYLVTPIDQQPDMTAQRNLNSNHRKNIMLLLLLFSAPHFSLSQKTKVDSLTNLLATEKTDTGKVKLQWQLAWDMATYNPDTALILAQQALFKAREIQYTEGESKSLSILANILVKIGNYPRGLEFHIERLKMEEKRKNPHNIATVFNNIGIVYIMQEEYAKALIYYNKADSISKKYKITEFTHFFLLNKGDVFDRLNQTDSARFYYSEALRISRELEDENLTGAALTGLGHVYRKKKQYPVALENYRQGIKYLVKTNDDELYCEATLGLAKLFNDNNKFDSAGYYATQSFDVARHAGFQNKELEAAIFLAEQYKQINKIDSAFSYINYVQHLNDSINSKDRIRESQVLSSNEQLRQLQMEQEKAKERKKRLQRMQLMLIAIFIPGFFLLTIFLSKKSVHIKLLRLLGVLSLLFLFEYLTLLLHPVVANFTHHNPVFEILIFVAIAAMLIPLHHKLEHWLIHKLIHHRHGHPPAKNPDTDLK
jgi:tetratricopeptide (TPR) repeat protein